MFVFFSGGLVNFVECASPRTLVYCSKATTTELALRFFVSNFAAVHLRAKGKAFCQSESLQFLNKTSACMYDNPISSRYVFLILDSSRILRYRKKTWTVLQIYVLSILCSFRCHFHIGVSKLELH